MNDSNDSVATQLIFKKSMCIHMYIKTNIHTNHNGESITINLQMVKLY